MATKAKGTGPKKTGAAAPEQQRNTGPSRSTAVSPAKSNLPANVNYGGLEGGNAGMEGADKDSYAIPFLLILQKLSPQLDRNDPLYIKGANEGDILNSANQEVYDGQEGIVVMPTLFKRSYTAWGIREKGGGFKGEYTPSDQIIMTTVKDAKNRNILPDNVTQLVDTRMHAVVLLNGDEPAPALCTMTSSQIKKSKRWMSQMQEFQRKDHAPTFAHVYKLTTVPEKNDQGNWMGWNIEYVGPATEQEHIDAAVGFYKSLATGAKKMNANSDAMGGEPGTE